MSIEKILSIAGSDSGSGAGIQADIKTAQAFDVYCSTAITSLTSQNTIGISDIYDIPANFVISQIRDVLSDIGADIIKTGMLCNAEIISGLYEFLEGNYPEIPLVVDPIMISSSGTKLISDDAISLIKTRLLKITNVITPNIPEAENFSNMKISSINDMRLAAQIIQKIGGDNLSVLITGGHLKSEIITDILLSKGKFTSFEHKRIKSSNTHGTGCTFATSIACGLALGNSLEEAVKNSQRFIANAITTAPNIGRGNGALNHHKQLKG